MSDSDLAERWLRLAALALPSHRRDWGEAMLAELATIDDAGARRRYALGCVRAVLSRPASLRNIAVSAFPVAFCIATLVLAAGVPSVGVRAETVVLVAIVGVVSWLGRRPGVLGPVGASRIARRVRGGGYLLVAAVQLLMLVSGGGGLRDPGGWWLLEVVIVLYLGATLVTTTATVDPRTLSVAVSFAVAGLIVWCAHLLQSPADAPYTPLWIVVGAMALAAVAVGRRSTGQILFVALGTGIATCLLLFVAMAATYHVFPQLAPDLAGSGIASGLTPAARVETSRIEAVDLYVAELMIGALLSAVALTRAAHVRPGVRSGRSPFGSTDVAVAATMVAPARTPDRRP